MTTMHVAPDSPDQFNRDTTGLPEAGTTALVDLVDGERYTLTAAPVRKRLGDAEVRLLAYNGSVPGPTLRVRQGSTITINFRNEADLENTVHWHGLRLDNRFDGTHETQAPVPVGGQFTYRVHFPDPGVYWYHPHVREDYGQELGLYGSVIVKPAEAEYWPPAHRELTLMLDDILIEDGRVASFSRTETTYAAMGRYGNLLLVNGEPESDVVAQRDEVVRLYLTNTANTRVFNVALNGARMKVIGGDSGRSEHEAFAESVLLAPSERVVVDVLFDTPGRVTLEHRTPGGTSTLATFTVGDQPAAPALADAFTTLRSNPEFVSERERLLTYLHAKPAKTLGFTATMSMGEPEHGEGPAGYACPMHPEVVSDEPGRCPICGMALLSAVVIAQAGGHGHHEAMDHTTHEAPAHSQHAGRGGHCQAAGPVKHESHASHAQHGHQPTAHHHPAEADTIWRGIEWEDDMVEVNRITTPSTMHWTLVDRETGAEGHAIDWRFRVGERVKIRLVNEMDSDHPMHHPFHIHGAGRFLVLSRNGGAEQNLVWKDTVLVRTGETVDILLEVTNPGVWMAHCHIAEHHESGMMLSFHVTE